jgi:RimJ/RimL family protein N-acetyltransferase
MGLHMSNVITSVRDALISLPLPLYASTKIGSLRSKEGDDFSLVIGADKNVVEQLKRYSLDIADTEIQNNTSDRVRFGEGSYEEWYSKDRTPFSLIHDATGKLAAFVWFGPKPLGRPSLKYLSEEERAKELEQKEDVWHTLVYRSYAPFRGKGLMGDFVRFAIEKYKEHYPEAKLWTGMSADNTASIGLASKLGFKRREEFFDTKKNWVAMTQE